MLKCARSSGMPVPMLIAALWELFHYRCHESTQTHLQESP